MHFHGRSTNLVRIIDFAANGCLISFLFAALLQAQQSSFDGTWQMDSAKSHVSDGRTVTVTIATVENGIKMTFKTRKSDGQEITSEFTSKLDGKPSEFAEGAHKWKITMWYNCPLDRQMMTMTINHYEPAAADETLCATRLPDSEHGRDMMAK